uniref:Methyltransferase like 4 n=1 Tax=Neogobius melanostomus TaxID=47308 RepID=A0A8C6TYB0_9GOBI
MSVVFQSSLGWVVDPCSLIDQSYSRCIRWSEKHKEPVQCNFKRQCFKTIISHINEKKCEAVNAGNVVISCKQAKNSIKAKLISKISMKRLIIHYVFTQVRTVILEGTLSLVASARACEYLNTNEECTPEDTVTFPESGLSALCEMAKQLPLVDNEESDTSAQALDGRSTLDLDLFSRMTENRSSSALVVTLMGQEYLIPAHSAFLLSDFTRLQPLIHCNYGAKFDLIVIDPPWENKSVKRSRRYDSLPSSQLKKLPIPLLASSDCLVVTWVTNRPSHLRFVRDDLYPHWGVEVITEWFWVKVTTSGQFVFPLDSEHKKPYEVMVLGRFVYYYFMPYCILDFFFVCVQFDTRMSMSF